MSTPRVLVLFYSTYGHAFHMAKAAAAAINTDLAGQATAVLKRVPETLPDDILDKLGAVKEVRAQYADVPVANPNELADYDGLLLSIPTRFGNMPAQMKSFIDATGQLWMKGALVGKPAGVMVSTAGQHAGNEATALATHTVLMHHGMVVVGLPSAFPDNHTVDEVAGGSPYGATTVAGDMGQRMPSKIDLAGASYHATHLAKIAVKLAAAGEKKDKE